MDKSGIGAGLELMKEGCFVEDDKLQDLKNGPQEVRVLNQIFYRKWSLEVVDTGKIDGEFVVQVRLFINGMGFRDGLGSSIDPATAKLRALRDAMAMVGFQFVEQDEDSLVDIIVKLGVESPKLLNEYLVRWVYEDPTSNIAAKTRGLDQPWKILRDEFAFNRFRNWLENNTNKPDTV